jgi:hypothetical protein
MNAAPHQRELVASHIRYCLASLSTFTNIAMLTQLSQEAYGIFAWFQVWFTRGNALLQSIPYHPSRARGGHADRPFQQSQR